MIEQQIPVFLLSAFLAGTFFGLLGIKRPLLQGWALPLSALVTTTAWLAYAMAATWSPEMGVESLIRDGVIAGCGMLVLATAAASAGFFLSLCIERVLKRR